MKFFEKLAEAIKKNNSFVCVGLDPDPNIVPDGIDILEFNREIISSTSDLVCAYKLNFAFYEVLEDGGFSTLRDTIKYIPDNIPVIGDAKRGDIGNTAKAYASSIFNNFDFDATTVNPYLGFDSIEPFIEFKDKGIFVLCRTSNSGALDFQSLHCNTEDGYYTLFEVVARKASEWNINGNIGLVVGATYPEELQLIRKNHPDMPMLIPGIGAQGGDLATVVRYGITNQGDKAIINSSRQIIYASSGKDFAQAARAAAYELREEINSQLASL